MKIQIWGSSLKPEVLAQRECWADIPTWQQLAAAENGACLRLACPVQLTISYLNTPGQIYSHLIYLAPVSIQVKTPALLGWIDFQVSLSVWNLAICIRNSAPGLGAGRSDFSHSKKSSGGQGGCGH